VKEPSSMKALARKRNDGNISIEMRGLKILEG
jgi:hypothetical protein